MEWVVARGDGSCVADIVQKMRALGAPERARVFVDGRPAADEDPVAPGVRVELWPIRDSFRGRHGPDPVEILTHRDGVVLAYKPTGLPTETTQLGQSSLLSALMEMLKTGKIHAASRLDTAVSGVVLCTLGRDAARRIHRWREAGQLRSQYLAIAAGDVPEQGRWEQPLGRTRDRGGRHRASPKAPETRDSLTVYRRIASVADASLLVLSPQTGRMHQLRAHAALAGAPLFGDRLYGGPTTVTNDDGIVSAVEGIALHCMRIELPHAVANAPPPERLDTLWQSLGGDDMPLASM